MIENGNRPSDARELFALEAWETLIQLDRCFDRALTEETTQRAVVLAHRMKGSAGLQGCPGLVQAAESLERLLMVAALGDATVGPDQLRGRLNPLVQELLAFTRGEAASSPLPVAPIDEPVEGDGLDSQGEAARAEPSVSEVAEPAPLPVVAQHPVAPEIEPSTEAPTASPTAPSFEEPVAASFASIAAEIDNLDDATAEYASSEPTSTEQTHTTPLSSTPPSASTRDASVQRDTVQENAAQKKTIQDDAVQDDAVPDDAVRSGSAQSLTVQNAVTASDDAERGAVEIDPAVGASPAQAPPSHDRIEASGPAENGEVAPTGAPVGAATSAATEASAPTVRTPDAVEARILHFQREQEDALSYFRPEVEELLETIGEGLRGGAMQSDEDWVHRMFRAFHTVKGSSLIVGCEPLGELAHLAEDHLAKVRDGSSPVPDLAWLRRVHRLANRMLWFDGALGESLAAELAVVEQGAPGRVSETAESRVDGGAVAEAASEAPAADTPAPEFAIPTESAPVDTASSEAESAAAGGEVAAPVEETKPPVDIPVVAKPISAVGEKTVFETLRVDVRRIDRIINGLSEIASQRSQLEQTIESLEQLRYQVEVDERRVTRFARTFEKRVESLGSEDAANPRQPSAFGVGEFEADDDLGLLSRQIAEISSDLEELGERLEVEISTVRARHGRLHKTAANLRTEMGRLRMVPMSRVFSRLRRSLEAATPPEMDVRFEVDGESTEVDNAVFEGVFEALEHVLRNAVAHGLESAEERVRLGKPAHGTVRVQATQTRTSVRLEISDDGRGIALDRVADRAVSLGLKTREEIDAMGKERLWELIQLPGLSTRDVADSQAGRGVGMDVVANRVRRVGGELLVETEAGRGTRFTFELPLTLVVSDVLVFRAANRAFAMPSRRVEKVVPIRRSKGAAPLGRTIEIDGENHPLVAVEGLLGLDREAPPDLGGAVLRVRTAAGHRAIEVDSIHGVEEVVLRNPGVFLEELDYLQGAFVADDGEIVLVLNPEGLVALDERVAPVVREVGDRTARALLVDDSVSVRRVVGDQLRQLGLDVEVAGDGVEALKALDEGDFDLVLTDLEMPNMHGYDLIERIRIRYADLPIVVMSTRVSEKHREAAGRLGVSRVFAKPVAPDELMAATRLVARKAS